MNSLVRMLGEQAVAVGPAAGVQLRDVGID
jgi:hypothetical protein